MSDHDFVIVSIDGGAASGKSSTSRALRKRFNLLHVDTGSFYRTLAHSLLQAGVTPEDPEKVKAALPQIGISTGVVEGEAIMLVDGAPPGDAIRSPSVNENVSRFAAQPAVRDYLLSYQRNQVQIARENGFPGLIMEGRDIGSVIFPEADFQFFLVADEQERMRRRADQGQQDEIRKRDTLDSQRKTSPLVCPPRALQINSTNLSLTEVVDEISQHLSERLPRADS